LVARLVLAKKRAGKDNPSITRKVAEAVKLKI
jgi:hypothetical protein